MKFIIIIILLIAFSNAYAQQQLDLIATIAGEKPGDNFCNVKGVGDVNGDGYDDVLIGALGGNYAKLYFGGAPFDTIADLKFLPDAYGSKFGYSLDGGGDLNGDGYADIIIGAPYSSSGPPDYFYAAGKVYVYFGGPQIDSEPDVIMEGAGWHYQFGHSVSFAGDMNSDGFDDIVVGAPNDDIDAHGRAYIYFGGANMDSIVDVLIEGTEPFDMLGESVSGAGDVNGDGFDDVLIGAPQMLAQRDIGKAYLIYGGDEIGPINSDLFIGDTTKHYYGRWVSGLGDVNNDGFNDFGILSDWLINIYFGNTIIDSIPELTLIPDRDFWYLGGLGDINKDGFDDFVAVSKYVDIFLGNSSLDTIPDISFSLWYSPICGVGDINGDSHVEIGFGRGGGWDPTGKVYIYSYGIVDKIEEKKDENYPEEFKLNQNYPNPFNSSTTISYDLSVSCSIRLEIFNCLARKIKILVLEQQNPGSYNVTWNGKDFNDQDVASGIYLAKLKVEYLNKTKSHLIKTQKLVLIR
ncbi:MAG TPA: T9SS type A sorting domain-containing protein [Bacteroidetes bacterium]|nr:T9SS type A sorting domain-containing protein [Bacteroidota bacterium]